MPGNVSASNGTKGIDPPLPISTTSRPKASASASLAAAYAGVVVSTR